MYPGNTSSADTPETPLEIAVEQEDLETSAQWKTVHDKAEASAVLSDIEDYVASSDPASLPEAEAELRAWKIPVDAPYTNNTAEDARAPLVSVLSVSSEAEAYIVRGLLEANGIPVMVREVATPVYGSALQQGEGRWGDILVAQHQMESAKQIIAPSIEPGSAGESD